MDVTPFRTLIDPCYTLHHVNIGRPHEKKVRRTENMEYTLNSNFSTYFCMNRFNDLDFIRRNREMYARTVHNYNYRWCFFPFHGVWEAKCWIHWKKALMQSPLEGIIKMPQGQLTFLDSIENLVIHAFSFEKILQTKFPSFANFFVVVRMWLTFLDH